MRSYKLRLDNLFILVQNDIGTDRSDPFGRESGMDEFKDLSNGLDIVISGYDTNGEDTVIGYRFDMEGNTQKLWQTNIEQASFVCRWDEFLFTVTESDDYCIVYLLKRWNGRYSLMDQRKLEGGALCHITYSPKHHTLYGACYGTGTIFGIIVEEDHFGEVIFHEIQRTPGKGELTRAHCVLLHAKENRLLTVNIALDEIIDYELQEGTPIFLERLDLPEGVGPRHAVFSEDETRLYVITEYSNEIFVFQTGENRLLQRISTLPTHYQGISNGSTLCISGSGEFLYAANRGADTVTQFRIDSKGELEWIMDYPCGGKHPRHMLLTKENEMLIICNLFSNNVVAFQIDEISGELRNKVFDLNFNSPSGIVQL